MSKYIIEIADDVQYVLLNGQTDHKCYTAVRPVAELEVLNSDYINEHYGELQDEAYQRGYEDGKKYFANGCVGCQYESDESRVNPCCECARVCNDHYIPKHSDRIEVGDEVVFETEGAEPFVILHKYYDDAGHPSGYSYFVYAQNGEVLIFNEGDGPKKTGRHFQETNKLLEAMRTHD